MSLGAVIQVFMQLILLSVTRRPMQKDVFCSQAGIFDFETCPNSKELQ